MATFSQDPVFGANAKKGSNAYASGANQNCGNVITDRPTTRLHAPPGGSSSISLGDAHSTTPAPRSLGAAVGAAPAAPAAAAAAAPTAPAEQPIFGARSAKGSNAYASGANQNCGNVLTDRPTTRLHAPPGGTSSVTFG